MNSLWRCVFWVVLLSVNGCSESPDNKIIDEVKQEIVKTESIEGVFDIRNVRVTNSWTRNGSFYVEFTFERYCLVGIAEAISQVRQEANQSKPEDLVTALAVGLLDMATSSGFAELLLANQYGKFKKGDKLEEIMVVEFIKTKNGWQYI